MSLIDEHSQPRLWILSLTLSFQSSRERYFVVDDEPADEANPNAKRKNYNLAPDRVMPLYSLDTFPLSKRRRFMPGERVLALYPGTTTFYPCEVFQTAKLTKPPYEYVLVFDDDDGQRVNVSAEFVAPIPEKWRN